MNCSNQTSGNGEGSQEWYYWMRNEVISWIGISENEMMAVGALFAGNHWSKKE